MKYKSDTTAYGYDYDNKCDCSEDDNCGCNYPNNMERNFGSDTKQNAFRTDEGRPVVQALIGRPAPNFVAPALLSDNTLVEEYNYYEQTDGYASVLFFYPEDFSFTCPSELLMLNRELNAFSRRQAKVLAISTDSIYSHLAWKEIPPHRDGIADISFPLIADNHKIICRSYQVLSLKETAHRATFIVDKNHIIRHISLNDYKVWRNPTEILRIIDILNYKGDGITNCPPGWKQNFFHERPEQETVTEMYLRRKDQ